ncbi:MAG: hypothetical protein Q4G21_02750 [Dermabacter sp.]|nr:hypothetical protein [Dermabacter sp.]
MKKLINTAVAFGFSAALVLGLAANANAETLGWDEDASSNSAPSEISFRSNVKHTGKAEEKTIRGTTNKRAHGWTTWVGQYHYTRARLEKGKKVTGDSGRKWGNNGTEAVSPWKPYYLLSGNLESPGSAKTYYGK